MCPFVDVFSLHFAMFPQCEALVNITDQNLGFGDYVSKALLKGAGERLKDECDKKKPIAMGGVAVTGAGNLKCKHIIHTVLPIYDGPNGIAEKVCKYFVFWLIITNILVVIIGMQLVNCIKWRSPT